MAQVAIGALQLWRKFWIFSEAWAQSAITTCALFVEAISRQNRFCLRLSFWETVSNRNAECISHLWHMVIFLSLLQMFENFLEEGQSVLAESPKMATATPSTNLKANTRPLFLKGLPYSPSPFNVKQFLWPSFTPLKKRKRELSGWIQVGVHLLESSPSLNLSNGAEMNKQRIPKHLYFGLNIAPCQVFSESEKNS